MSAAQEARTSGKSRAGKIHSKPIKAGVKIWQNTQGVLDAGYAKPGVSAAGLVAIGKACGTYDNTDGDDGDIYGDFEYGEFTWDNGESITQANVGDVAYVKDDQTVALTATSRSPAGEITGIDSSGQIWVRTTDDLGTIAGFAATGATASSSTPAALGVAATAGAGTSFSRDDHVHAWAQKKTVTITHADLTSDVDNTPQAINVSTALPANAIVVGLMMTLTTQFTGGGASAVTMDVGWSGSTEALVKDFDAFGATASAAVYDAGASAATFGMPKLASAKQLIATFVTDSGHDVEDLTAGSITIDVFYVVAF